MRWAKWRSNWLVGLGALVVLHGCGTQTNRSSVRTEQAANLPALEAPAPDNAGAAGGPAADAVPSGGGDAVLGPANVAPPEEPVVPQSEPWFSRPLADEDGYALWLRYPKVADPTVLAAYQAALRSIVVAQGSPTVDLAVAELERGLSGLLGTTLSRSTSVQGQGSILIGTPASSPLISNVAGQTLAALGTDGYFVLSTQLDGAPALVLAGNGELGVLYGVFALLRHLQTFGSLEQLSLRGAPRIQHRILEHWDNLDRTVEHGYAGPSIWEWDVLPTAISGRYRDYARANASIGINGAVLTNAGSNAQALTPVYLARVRVIADELRPYGIRTYLSARFSAPIEVGGLASADPALPEVQLWWRTKVNEIYALIPDFGGFVVQAGAGQPGPSDYQRSHAEGANVIADALLPHAGILLWHAGVLDAPGTPSPADPVRLTYQALQPLDGQFGENVVLQIESGALGSQPREPFHPLLGAMPGTPLGLELQVTKEYLGQDTHLAYLGPLFQELLESDTKVAGSGSTVARVIDGSLQSQTLTAIAGVANVGSDRNWTGSHFNQANWYVFGRMAWDPSLSAEQVAEEWVRQTFSNDPNVVQPVTRMMMASREALVSYMTPLGLTHLAAPGHHYGPAPWADDASRPEQAAVYHHRADATGIGFDRTASGSNTAALYAPEVASALASVETTPLEQLLFFHHVPWTLTLSTGRTLWEELVQRYSTGVEQARELGATWQLVRGKLDEQRFAEIESFLAIQADEAEWWRDASLAYFGSVSGLMLPAGDEPPAQPLSYYQGLACPADPARPRCPEVYAP